MHETSIFKHIINLSLKLIGGMKCKQQCNRRIERCLDYAYCAAKC
jgi:hypothetical protein